MIQNTNILLLWNKCYAMNMCFNLWQKYNYLNILQCPYAVYTRLLQVIPADTCRRKSTFARINLLVTNMSPIRNKAGGGTKHPAGHSTSISQHLNISPSFHIYDTYNVTQTLRFHKHEIYEFYKKSIISLNDTNKIICIVSNIKNLMTMRKIQVLYLSHLL